MRSSAGRCAGSPRLICSRLEQGLRIQGDRLVSGRLYGPYAGGGCAVGILLRELDPAEYSRGRLHFLLRHRWRRTSGSYRQLRRANPRLRHLERIFDKSVELVHKRGSFPGERSVIRAVGAWIALRTSEELSRRWRATQESAALSSVVALTGAAKVAGRRERPTALAAG